MTYLDTRHAPHRRRCLRLHELAHSLHIYTVLAVVLNILFVLIVCCADVAYSPSPYRLSYRLTTWKIR
jgi:hypothetical protein